MDNRFEKTKPKESTLFNQLPENIQVEIFHNLNIQEKSNLAMVDRNCYQLFSKYIYAQKLIMLVAHGDEAGASSLLDRFPNLALERGDITDYSGRTFKNITAYEYAYWARDWHMLDMLEAHMSPEQKTKMLQKIDAIEQHGLTYTTQNGETKTSKHFSLQPLIDKYNDYLAIYARWDATPQTASYDDLERAWLDIGLEQRNLPAYVIQEYCRPDRSFHPRPEFNEPNLLRSFNVYKYWSHSVVRCFPLDAAPDFHLGLHFSLLRYGAALHGCRVAMTSAPDDTADVDLAAVCHLDVVSNVKVTQSRDNLMHGAQERAAYGASV